MYMLYYFSSGWINGQLVADDLGVEIGHLSSTPYKQVCILPQASYNMLPLQVGESDVDLHAFVRVFTEGDELKVSVWDWSEESLLAIGCFILVVGMSMGRGGVGGTLPHLFPRHQIHSPSPSLISVTGEFLSPSPFSADPRSPRGSP